MLKTKSLSLRSFATACLVGLLASGTAMAQSADPSTYATERFAPHEVALPAGTGCAADIARFQTIMDNDYRTGNVNQSVYAQIEKDLDAASRACAAGQDGQARAMVRSTRSRHGYPAG